MKLAGVTRSQIRAELLKRSYADFFRAAWTIHEPSTPLVWGWALQATCDHLQALVEDWARRQREPLFVQRLRDLLITAPPGSAKSRLLALLVPWTWLRWPSLRAICLSSNPRVALRDSMIARDVIASDWYRSTFRPRWTIRDDADAKGSFINTAGGFRSAMGIDARIVGERSDLICVDDPHDPDEAESDALRNAVHERWTSSIGNRVNDLGASIRVGIAHRTHEDDWSARRIAEGWTHLDLPLLFEAERHCETPLGKPDPRTVDGECIDPARFPPDVVAAERKRVGERRFATLYQGRPAPADGAMVKLEHLRFWRAPDAPDASRTRPSGCWKGPAVELPSSMDTITITSDCAGGEVTKDGDYNVIVAVGRRGASFYVLDVWRKRAAFPELEQRFEAFARRWPNSRKVIEHAAAGIPLAAALKKRVPGLVSKPARGSKRSRVLGVLAFFEAANVHLPEGLPGLDELITELVTFPNARHDDFPDALATALHWCAPNVANDVKLVFGSEQITPASSTTDPRGYTKTVYGF